MITADPHALTGAYALDALPDEERRIFERHLAHCESCAREVAGLTATAVALGLAVAASPGPAMRQRVLRRITAVRQESPDVGPEGGHDPLRAGGDLEAPSPAQVPGLPADSAGRASDGKGDPPGSETAPDHARAPQDGRYPGLGAEVPRGVQDVGHRSRSGPDRENRDTDGPGPGLRPGRAGRRGRAATRWALAACLAAAAGLGGTAVWQHEQAEDARAEARQARANAAATAAVLTAPDARTGAARLPGGARAAVVVSRSLDRAVFVSADMAAPPRGKVYQLWFDDSGTMRPAGLMDPGRADQSVLMRGAVDGADGMGITVEPAGGSAEPTSAPVAVLALPS